MKVLILRFSSIGDIVLTSPVVRCLKKQTGAEIHFLTKKSFEATVAENPFIDRVFTFEKSPLEVVTHLKPMSYDWVIDLHHNLRSLRLKRILGIKSRSFNKLNFEKWLLVNLKIDRLPSVHIVERYLKTVEPLGVFYDGAGLDFFIPFEFEVEIGAEFGLLENQFLAFVLGATHATKRLPIEKMEEICLFLQKNKIPTVLLGGRAESEIGEKLATKFGLLNFCGKFNLFESASILKQSRLVLTHDTGLMHIAAAFQKNIISVWGNTIPKFGMTPFFSEGGGGSDLQVETLGLGCRPCSKIGFDRCPRGHFNCMNRLPMEKIFTALRLHFSDFFSENV